MAADTWIPAYRKLFEPDHHLSLGRPSCPRFAWLDLCQMATREARTVAYGHELIELQSGELVASVRTLADRWKWSKSAVSRFMGTLEKRDSIRAVRGTPAGTVYLIENKDLYWLGRDSERDTTGTASGTGEGQDADKNNTYKKKETTDDVRLVFEHWQKASGHDRTKLTSDRRQKIRSRLQTFTVDELNTAISKACADPFYQGDNDRSTRYDWIETLLKNDGTVDRHLNKQPAKKNGTPNHHGGPYIPGLNR